MDNLKTNIITKESLAELKIYLTSNYGVDEKTFDYIMECTYDKLCNSEDIDRYNSKITEILNGRHKFVFTTIAALYECAHKEPIEDSKKKEWESQEDIFFDGFFKLY
ncbi:MAG: hypothetical protein ACRCXX_09575 [Cetobacterium sp.]|uniref:hypothetical protein n=1 Tax=Cetobacterium sp. TaxID=2071632 RepID=UPI003F2B8947